ncbi:uncharacterized protein LOC119986973 [Tripterygium wilfordii]|uniref:uncharacterized protein LOC119986973 n=1 Tax=Tripterygium wilfordii TaxID=458696 RepID=UPI0018F846A3|nr:uncharacterized protein LOC119986973 [Tripterygium wilfordii]
MFLLQAHSEYGRRRRRNPVEDISNNRVYNGTTHSGQKGITCMRNTVSHRVGVPDSDIDSSAKLLHGGSLPEKVWLKQQFSIGVNDVTRLLEQMAPTSVTGNSHEHRNNVIRAHR